MLRPIALAAILISTAALASTPADPVADTPCTTSSSAQPATTRIAVTDASGAAVQRAVVELRCGTTVLTTQTGADGIASLTVRSSQYRLTVEASGFSSIVQTLTLPAISGETTIALSPGSAADTINVIADNGFVPFSSNTGSKTGALLVEVPQSISIIGQRELQARNVTTVNEALRYTPGVQADEYGVELRHDWLKIRGFSADTTGVFRDGMRWNSLAGKMDPYELESVEVLKGPSSVLYGQAPPGGLVNLTTKRPTSETQRELQTQFGAYNRRQVQADFGGPIDLQGVWRYRLIGLVRNSGTQINYTPDDRRFIAPSLTWHPSDRTNITALGDWQHDRTRWSQFLPASGTLYKNNPNGSIPVNVFAGEPDWEHVVRDQASIGYMADHLFADGWNLHQNYRFQHVNFNGSVVYGVGFVDGSNSLLNRLADQYPQVTDIHTLDTRALRRYTTPNWQHTVLGGYDYVNLAMRTRDSYAAAPPIDIFHPVYGAPIPALNPSQNNNVINQQHGAYLQDQVKFKQHLVFTLGGREDWAITDLKDYLALATQHQNDSKFTGRAGITYLTNIGINPYYSYSTSFQPTTGSTTFDGKLFRPSLGRQHEAGFKIQPRTWSSYITASVFNINQTNVLTIDTQHPLFSVQTGEVRSRGVEVEGVASLSRGWNLHAGYSLIDTAITAASPAAQDQLGKRFPQTPRNQTSLLADYTVPNRKLAGLGGNIGIRFTGKSAGDTLNTLIIPNYTLLDAAIRFGFHHMDFAVHATNITDRRYVATCTGLAYCGYGYARNVIGTAKYHF